MLFYAGLIDVLGEVDEGTTVTDWMLQEQERGITISSAAITCPWRGHAVTIVDMPGHIDFTAEVERCLRVLDGGVAIFSAVDGVQTQSETVWQQAERHAVPCVLFINKMDRPGADFDGVCAEIGQRLRARAVPFQIPLHTGGVFRGGVDLLRGVAVTFEEADRGLRPVVSPVPGPMRAAVQRARDVLFEAIIDSDALLEQYIMTGDVPIAEALAAARRAVLCRRVFPVFCGAARQNIGVQPILDAIVDFLPSPSEMGEIVGYQVRDRGELEARDTTSTAPAAALVFKVVHHYRLGILTYLRLYSGVLRTGDQVLNPRTGAVIALPTLVRTQASDAEEIDEASAGDIVAVVGAIHAGTGDTLCAPEAPLVLEPIEFPTPVIFQALIPETDDDHDKLFEKLNNLLEEDPTLVVRSDPETGETLLGGMGELHLEVALDRLRRDHGVRVRAGKPAVVNRRTIAASGSALVAAVNQIGGEVVCCRVELAAGDVGHGVQVRVFAGADEQQPTGSAQPLFADVLRALTTETMDGVPLSDVDVLIRLDSLPANEGAWRQLRAWIRSLVSSALTKAPLVTTEPIMHLEILTPQTYVGPILGDVQARAGQVTSVCGRGTQQQLSCLIPLSRTFGYASSLRSLTHGRATCSLSFSHFGVSASS